MVVFSAGLIFLAVGWIWGLFYSPTDAEQGDVYRIIYLQGPPAITAQLIYCIIEPLLFIQALRKSNKM